MRQRVEARNELEMFAYNLKDQINSKDKLGSKISKEDKKKIERAITKTLDWINSNESAGSKYKLYIKKLKQVFIQQNINSITWMFFS